MTLYLFWDIDGTLLLTARAGVFALEEASEEVLGAARRPLRRCRRPGMTDSEIAAELVRRARRRRPGAPRRLLRRLRAAAAGRGSGWRQGRVLPNVRENLEALSGRDDVVNMLLTGNVAGGAEAKLRHYGLWDFFGAGGAFCVEGCDRPAIARRARELAAEHGGEVPPGERMVVIGDTPHDVSLRQRDRRPHAGGGHRPRLRPRRAARRASRGRRVAELPAPPALERLLGLDGR